MKIYLASRYSRREELCKYRDELVAAGHEVTSSWLDTNWRPNEEGASAAPPEYRREWAQKDFNDVRAAGCLIYFASGTRGRGGCHVEVGIALGIQSTVVVIGEPENLFHFLPNVIRVESWEKFKQQWMGIKEKQDAP